MILNIIIRTALIVVVFFLAVILHEVGHMFVYRLITKKKLKLRFHKGDFHCGDHEQIKLLDDDQYRLVLVAGIVLGLVPIFLLTSKLNMVEWLFLFAMYCWGSKSDAIQIWKMGGEDDKEKTE